MDQLKDYFYIKVANDNMHAELYCTDQYSNEEAVDESSFRVFLENHNIKSGIKEEAIHALLNKNLSTNDFPILIAQGTPCEPGKNGEIDFKLNLETRPTATETWDFRDVMRIPSVKKGEKLATIILPTDGIDGMDIRGRKVKALPGKQAPEKPGKNVVYRESDLSFYAASDGQVNITRRHINIHSVYEVKEALSMETGNLDFVGSIIIHGDVPSGFKVKAGGDVKVFGIVEAAEVVAEGSVYISEGFAGLNKGKVTASESIHVGYINQGRAYAGENIFVENSIIHSECTAKKQVICKHGNIIGGTTSAGEYIEAKDIGNRLSTKTEISIGYDKAIFEQEQSLIAEKKELEETLKKLKVLGEKLTQTNHLNDNAKHRIMLLRQKKSYENAQQKLVKVKGALFDINAFIGSEKDAKLKVRHQVYPNAIITFGKYKMVIKELRTNVELMLEVNEIVIRNG